MKDIVNEVVKNTQKASTKGEDYKKKNNKIDEDLKKLLDRKITNIKVIGTGGGGNNTLSRLAQIGIEGAELIAMNTDAQDLLYADADHKFLIGEEVTMGLGAGSNPKKGEDAAKESKDGVDKLIGKSDMVFITCGLGGGTGTGSAPVISQIAKKNGALTIAIVTLPFSMEGRARQMNAKEGLKKLEQSVDTLIVIPNDKLLTIVPDVSIDTAFKVADEILVNAVKGITELVTKPGLINLDFADIKTVMQEGGLAMIGMGQSDTENRAEEAVSKALSNPLLDVDIDGADGALINITGGTDLTLKESQEVVNAVSTRLDPNAKIIWGAQIQREFGEALRVMVIITGVNSPQIFGGEHSIKQEEKKEIENELGIDFI
jgi:cell division protein FtsZ